jgi:hypothetical protein
MDNKKRKTPDTKKKQIEKEPIYVEDEVITTTVAVPTPTPSPSIDMDLIFQMKRDLEAHEKRISELDQFIRSNNSLLLSQELGPATTTTTTTTSRSDTKTLTRVRYN